MGAVDVDMTADDARVEQQDNASPTDGSPPLRLYSVKTRRPQNVYAVTHHEQSDMPNGPHPTCGARVLHACCSRVTARPTEALVNNRPSSLDGRMVSARSLDLPIIFRSLALCSASYATDVMPGQLGRTHHAQTALQVDPK